MSKDYVLIGKSVPKIEGTAMAAGLAQYTEDLRLPGMLHGKILRSPHAHARIVRIDTSKAQNLPGVKAVMTGADILPVKYGIVPFGADEYGVAIDKVRYIGDEVAAVAAVDEDTAETALELIEVEYEILPAVFTPEGSMAAGAPIIHDNVPDNVSVTIHKEWGNVAGGFAAADYVREDQFMTQAVAHAPMELHISMAHYDLAGKLTVWSSKQLPFYLKRNLSKTLGLPENRIRVIKPMVGGGFGGKVDMFAHDFCSGFLAMKTGRPVRVVYSREESLAATRGRHPMVVTIKTGVRKDGTIVAQQYHVLADGGAYNSTAHTLLTLSAIFSMIPYRIPNLLFDGYHVYTNKPTSGAMRGHGIPQVRFACESQLEAIAEDIGLDPVELRQRNAIKAGEEHPGGLTIRSCGFSECITKAADEIGWNEKRQQKSEVKTVLHGVGMGCSGFPCGANNMSHVGTRVVIKLERDGSATVFCGASDIGQGANTIFVQMVAEELGIDMRDVRLVAADTELTPFDPGTFGSGVTFRAGNAVRAAAVDAKKKIMVVVANELEVALNDLEARDHRIYVKGSPEKGMTLVEALKVCQYAGHPVPIVGEGFFSPPAKEPTTLLTEMGDFSGAYSFGAQTAEVEIDVETGKIKVLKIVTAHDCGYALNPMAVEGQLEGSIATALGQVFTEGFIWDDQGATMNATFMDYKLPTVLDIPDAENNFDVETNDPIGPYGAKEAGEGVLVFTIPAVANAVSNALGYRITEVPITPEKILEILKKKKQKDR